MDNRTIFEKMRDWLLAGGFMKTFGRIITIIGIIVALVITGIGVADMYSAAGVQQQEKYDKAYAKQQSKVYKAMEKENKAAEKEGKEPPHVLPADASELVVEIDPVPLSLDDHIGPFITEYFVWAVLALAAGVALGWVIGSLPEWIAAMKDAGPVRVTAGAFFWAGVLVAAGFLLAGLWEILQINKSTLPEVGKILLEKYLIWSVAALGCGFGIKLLILNGPKEHAHVFESKKSNVLFKWLYLIVLFAAVFAVTACIMLAIVKGWLTGLIALLIVGAVVLVAWLLSGVCPLIRSKEEIEAEKERRARTSWVCDACGTENARSAATCSNCGEIKPVHHM